MIEGAKKFTKGDKTFLLLAFAVYVQDDFNEGCVVYCPDDNEHSIFVMSIDKFHRDYQPVVD